jgi:hypothetical protein
MVPEILGILDFRSNNDVNRPVIRALELIKKYAETGIHYIPFTSDIPIDIVIRTIYKEIIIEKDEKGQERINRINYDHRGRISDKGNGWISVSPLEPQAEQVNLIRIKGEISRCWPM